MNMYNGIIIMVYLIRGPTVILPPLIGSQKRSEAVIRWKSCRNLCRSWCFGVNATLHGRKGFHPAFAEDPFPFPWSLDDILVIWHVAVVPINIIHFGKSWNHGPNMGQFPDCWIPRGSWGRGLWHMIFCTAWWFGTWLLFAPIVGICWDDDPIWLII